MSFAVHSLDLIKTKFILPTANSIPITLNGGHSMPGWSDITGLDADSPEDRAGFTESSRRVTALVNNEVEHHGIPAAKIVVAGFSQVN